MDKEVSEKKIVAPPAPPRLGPKINHEERRRIRKIASKMINHSRAYILVMWNGKDDDEPVCVMDLAPLEGKETIIAKSMGKLAGTTAAVMRFCKEQLNMTSEEKSQAEMARLVKEQRSKEYEETNARAEGGAHE